MLKDVEDELQRKVKVIVLVALSKGQCHFNEALIMQKLF